MLVVRWLFVVGVQVCFVCDGTVRSSASSSIHRQFTAVCVSVCVCPWKEKKLISTGRNVFTSKGWMEGVCVRVCVRQREKERRDRARAVAADSCCSISLWASSCRQARQADRYRPGGMGGDGHGLRVWVWGGVCVCACWGGGQQRQGSGCRGSGWMERCFWLFVVVCRDRVAG